MYCWDGENEQGLGCGGPGGPIHILSEGQSGRCSSLDDRTVFGLCHCSSSVFDRVEQGHRGRKTRGAYRIHSCVLAFRSLVWVPWVDGGGALHWDWNVSGFGDYHGLNWMG